MMVNPGTWEAIRARLYTSKEVAEMVGVSQRTVRRWVRSGRIKPELILPNGSARFRVDDLTQLFKEKDESAGN